MENKKTEQKQTKTQKRAGARPLVRPGCSSRTYPIVGRGRWWAVHVTKSLLAAVR